MDELTFLSVCCGFLEVNIQHDLCWRSRQPGRGWGHTREESRQDLELLWKERRWWEWQDTGLLKSRIKQLLKLVFNCYFLTVTSNCHFKLSFKGLMQACSRLSLCVLLNILFSLCVCFQKRSQKENSSRAWWITRTSWGWYSTTSPRGSRINWRRRSHNTGRGINNKTNFSFTYFHSWLFKASLCTCIFLIPSGFQQVHVLSVNVAHLTTLRSCHTLWWQ